MAKYYKYDGEEFEVSAPKDCSITVKGMGYIGYVTIHEATGMYREDLLGWGSDHATLTNALNGCCRRIINRAKRDPKDSLCKNMNEFYDDLDG
ncbi:MAG: hypothetical protein OXH76_08345 [Boseongicola sp.]|nr:hypothetical protein [Boseongicola sp.]